MSLEEYCAQRLTRAIYGLAEEMTEYIILLEKAEPPPWMKNDQGACRVAAELPLGMPLKAAVVRSTSWGEERSFLSVRAAPDRFVEVDILTYHNRLTCFGSHSGDAILEENYGRRRWLKVAKFAEGAVVDILIDRDNGIEDPEYNGEDEAEEESFPLLEDQ